MRERVKKNLFQPINVVITCSKSGKLTLSLVRYWCEKCLAPAVNKKNAYCYQIRIGDRMIQRFIKIYRPNQLKEI